MHRTALRNLAQFSLLFVALICPNGVTLTVSTAQAGKDLSDSALPVSVHWRPGSRDTMPWRFDTPSGCNGRGGRGACPSSTPSGCNGRGPCPSSTPAWNGIGGRGWPTPWAGSDATWPGQPIMGHTRPNNSTVPVFFPILVMISIASLLAWRWHQGTRRNSAAPRTQLVAVADFGRQTIKFKSASQKRGTTFQDVHGRG